MQVVSDMPLHMNTTDASYDHKPFLPCILAHFLNTYMSPKW